MTETLIQDIPAGGLPAGTGDVRLKSRIAEKWSAHSATYDGDFGHGFCDDIHRVLWREALTRNAQPRPGLRILDVGCGTGFLSLQLAALGCVVTGIDFAPDMLARARSKAETAGLEIHFQSGDAEAPPFEAGSFDLVVCRHVVWTLPDPESAFRAWHRVLASDGRIMPVEGCWTPRTPGERFRSRLSALIERVAPTSGHDRHWKESYPATAADLPFFGGMTADALAEAVAKGGFEVVRVDRLSDIIRHERSQAPLSRKLLYGPGRRYILVARKGNQT